MTCKAQIMQLADDWTHLCSIRMPGTSAAALVHLGHSQSSLCLCIWYGVVEHMHFRDMCITSALFLNL